MIEPSEVELKGEWIRHENRVISGPIGTRIAGLVATHLQKLATRSDGWATLYEDPMDGRLWERWYPMSEMHGAGPAALRCIDREEASASYKLDFPS
jgi:hypothetical protein